MITQKLSDAFKLYDPEDLEEALDTLVYAAMRNEEGDAASIADAMATLTHAKKVYREVRKLVDIVPDC